MAILGDLVGFRYCIEKQYLQTAHQSYLRFITTVKRQCDSVISWTNHFYETMNIRPLFRALAKAKIEVYTNELPLNEFHSLPEMTQVYEKRREVTPDTLERCNYNYIEDAAMYLRQMGIYHWFLGEDKPAEYVIDRNATHTPLMPIKVHDVRIVGSAETFTISMNDGNGFCVAGIATCSN